ncbi:DUF1015 domain-containing protein [Candidatus Margulisiibacteriota bacterium]
MVQIKAFNGLMYNPEKINIQEVATEPYDKISPALQEKYYKRSPYNAVRLILGKQEAKDNDNDNRYTRAAGFLKDWQAKQILIEADKPQLFAYYQEYHVDGLTKVRKGLVALVQLEDFTSGKIRPHEKTLSKPKADRLNLLRATKTQFGHIFMLYSEPEKKINALLAEVISVNKPIYEVKDEYGSWHKLWSINDKDFIDMIIEMMKDKYLLIADGHHRYETACNFSKENGAWGKDEAYNYQMMTMVNMDDEGLTVLPTHRLLHDIELDWAKLHKDLGKYFKILQYSTFEELDAELIKAKKGKPRFGIYVNKDFYLLEMQDIKVMDTDIKVEHSTEWKHLDVSILHALIFEKLLGITLEKQAEQTNISYKRYPDEAIAAVDSGKEQAVFFLNPTNVHDVARIADKGETMPQKSTDFFPKLLTGLVMQKIS